MSEMSFEQMLDDESVKTIHNGEVVSGTVIDVKEDEIILNIGYKSDGIITRSEYTTDPNVDLRDLVHVDDQMEARVMKVNDGDGQVLLTYRRLAAEKGNKRLEDAYNSKEILTAPVVQVLSGGLSVLVDEARVFIPASLVSDTYEKNLEKYNGQEIEFRITEFNPRRRRIIGDRKQILLERKEQMQKELFERIHPGDVVEGTVKNVTDFGAFIDLGGADGLLHISEMSWGHVDNPKKMFKVGQPLTVLIKDINGNKIALSLKFEDQNPWLTAGEKYAAGKIVEGKVARMTDFGAFVELEPGVDALLHVSQISRNHVDKPSDVLSVGQVIKAKVVDFNGEDHKISLSMKAIEKPAQAQPEPKKSPEDAAEAAAEEEIGEKVADVMMQNAVAEAVAEAAADEAAEEAVGEAIEEEAAEEAVEEAIEEEAAEEAAEEIIEEEVEDLTQELEDEGVPAEAAEDIAESVVEDEVVDSLVDEAIEEEAAAEDASEAVEEMIAETAAEEAIEDTEEEIAEDLEKEGVPEDIAEDIAEDVVETVVEEELDEEDPKD